jgi:2-oxoglutarate dehydrogenase E2 component (dihydrolipoamide succinyltransferase)
VKEGETVPVNSVVATIGAPGAKAAPADAAAVPPPPVDDRGPAGPSAETPAPQADGAAITPAAAGGEPVAAVVEPAGAAPDKPAGERQRSSPLVRRIAKEHNVDIGQISGSGIGGRVTKNDILAFVENPSARAGQRAPSAGQSPASRAAGGQQPGPAMPAPGPAPSVFRLPGDRVEPMSVMRRKIAEHMVLSKHTSAHVYSVFEVNYSRVDQIRKAKKDDYERMGAKLTFTSFIAKAAVDCLRRHPTINASIDGDNVVYRGTVNLGIAVALDNGLIVPVVKGADEKNLLGLSRSIQDVADRARAKKLNPDEVQAGTFTITNPGNFGAQFGLPVINQPQVSILGVGTIEKRAVVIDDMIGIRLMGYLTLGYDHRLVDGAVADQFMAELKKTIENFDANQV